MACRAVPYRSKLQVMEDMNMMGSMSDSDADDDDDQEDDNDNDNCPGYIMGGETG